MVFGTSFWPCYKLVVLYSGVFLDEGAIHFLTKKLDGCRGQIGLSLSHVTWSRSASPISGQSLKGMVLRRFYNQRHKNDEE